MDSETIDCTSTNHQTQPKNKLQKLPYLKKLLEVTYEPMRKDMLEVLGASGVCFDYYEVKEELRNEWMTN